MNDLNHSVIDARLEEALSKYFNGISIRKTVGDCTILSAKRKQGGTPTDIYTPAYTVNDDAVRSSILKQFQSYEKLASDRLQATVRLYKDGPFRKMPALALLSCDIPTCDDAFDSRDQATRISVFLQMLEALSELHGAGIVHGGLSDQCLRRESSDGLVRLCDFGFSGERATTITSQNVAYQSRHVIRASQPRLVDDVHSAGMLGYRIFLGLKGAERVLTDDANPDTDTIVSTILGETGPAPDAAMLFPEGHENADHIARLLARMTGRADNMPPFSSAAAALNALKGVMSTPTLRVTKPTTGPVPEPKVEALTADAGIALSGSRAVRGHKARSVTPATAVVLFIGSIVGLGASAYFYLQASSAEERFQAAAIQANELSEIAATLSDQKNDLEASLSNAIAVGQLIRQSDREVTIARLTGANTASDAASTALTDAEASLDAAIQAFGASDLGQAEMAADRAKVEAQTAASALARAQDEADAARSGASAELAAAKTAAGRQDATLVVAVTQIAEAESAYLSERYAESQQIWQDARTAMVTYIDAKKEAARVARSEARDLSPVRKVISDEPDTVLGNWLIGRGDAAFQTGAFAEAEAYYVRATASFRKAEDGRSNGVRAQSGAVRDAGSAVSTVVDQQMGPRASANDVLAKIASRPKNAPIPAIVTSMTAQNEYCAWLVQQLSSEEGQIDDDRRADLEQQAALDCAGGKETW